MGKSKRLKPVLCETITVYICSEEGRFVQITGENKDKINNVLQKIFCLIHLVGKLNHA